MYRRKNQPEANQVQLNKDKAVPTPVQLLLAPSTLFYFKTWDSATKSCNNTTIHRLRKPQDASEGILLIYPTALQVPVLN